MNNFETLNVPGPSVANSIIKQVLLLTLSTGLVLGSASAFAVDTVFNVPGKEYSDDPDINATPPPTDPEQVLSFDGFGAVTDGYDYSGTRPSGSPDDDVDAIANSGDAFFNDVISNQADLLFSVVDSANIYAEKTSGAFLTWATEPNINGSGNMSEIDGLEVWGPDTDSNRYSLNGDWDIDAAGARVAVWAFDGVATSTPFIYQSSICTAIGLDPRMCGDVDVDAMMTLGESIMFSIDAIFDSTTGALVFDGGEIWTWTGIGAASFLSHGGHLWDTAFCVSCTFGLDSENINALEATPDASVVPVPAAVWLFGSGLIGLIAVSRRKSTA